MGILRVLCWEIYMNFSSTKRYKFGMLSDIIVFGLMMSFFIVSDTGASYAGEYGHANYKELMVLGYIAWTYATSALSTVTAIVSKELRQGTFYKQMNSKYPLQFLLGGKFISGELLQTVITAILLIVAVIIFKIDFTLHPMLVLLVVISTIGMYGIGLIIAGLSMFVKKTGSILFIIQTGLLFVTDTIPAADSVLSVTKLLPLTLCNMAMKQVVSGQSYIRTTLELTVSALAFLVIGIITFHVFINKAKKKGNLLFY